MVPPPPPPPADASLACGVSPFALMDWPLDFTTFAMITITPPPLPPRIAEYSLVIVPEPPPPPKKTVESLLKLLNRDPPRPPIPFQYSFKVSLVDVISPT